MKWKSVVSLCLILQCLLVGCTSKTPDIVPKEEPKLQGEEYDAQMEVASTTPFGKYPELITYTLGKMTGANNSNMPAWDTYEDNAYTRYLKEMLNVQNKNKFAASDNYYDDIVSMAIATNELPDIMVVSDREDLEKLVELDMIEDLSTVYETCTSDRIKEIYDSYGESVIDNVTFDGKIMAFPETNIEDGPSLLWLRKDWLDKLNLKEPKTIDDVEYIVKQFIEKDPGNNGEGETVGIVCDPELTGECGYSYEYQLDVVFASYNAYPKQWIHDEDGNVEYGSVQPEAKKALARIREMYQSGVLDPNFLLRTTTNIIELVVEGKCGSFFGPWWTPNNPLMEAMSKNPEANWQPYLIQTDKDGTVSYYSQNPTYKYVVVRKGYEHPEIAAKIISTIFDYMRYEDKDAVEIKRYYQLNVDPTARPLVINIDYNDALARCYDNITKTLDGELQESQLEILEYSYYESCKSYLEEGGDRTAEDWAAYTSRIAACSLLDKAKKVKVPSLFFAKTETMKSEWWKLKELEKETYLEIVTGEKPLDYFDSFVEEWYASGGEAITHEVSEKVNETQVKE